jgi:hypothetical protein
MDIIILEKEKVKKGGKWKENKLMKEKRKKINE